ncbi:MAG: matrixin family metalloprotease [Chloroflexota bacterium]
MKWLLRVFPPVFALIVSLTLVLVPQSATRAVMPEAFQDDIAVGADVIAIGTVVEQSSQWNAEHTRIFTSVVMDVEETLKGVPAGKRITVTVPGGTAEGITEWVSDAPGFAQGERAVAFLKKLPDASYEVYGQFQGKRTIDKQNQVEGLPLPKFKERITRALTRAPAAAPEGETLQAVGPITLEIPPLSGQTPPEQSPAIRVPGWQTIMTEGFEGAFPTGWYLYGNPSWGKDDFKPYTGLYSGWPAGVGTGAVDPAVSNYLNSMNAWMVYGPFDLSDAGAAELSFFRWIKTEATNDKLGVYLSTTNGTSGFYGYVWSGQRNYWYQNILDLRDWYYLGNLCGQSQVWVALVFQSNASVVDQGVFLDDISLRKYVGPEPQITSITPAQASAGTNSLVTINGTGFGASPGLVQFFYQDGEPLIEGNISSWSDTSIVTDVPTDIINSYPASAGSGPVRVRTADDVTSAFVPFTVTFSYGGVKWSGATPVVDFKVNPNTLDCESEEVAVQNAAATWTGVSDKSFAFSYNGTTSATIYGANGVNEILWRPFSSPGVLAHAVYWFDGSNFLEADIEFNDDYTWSTAATTPDTQWDVQTIALHELGHWLNLRDLYGDIAGYPQDVDKVMYGYGTNGTAKRVLHADDEAGIRWIYPLLNQYTLTINVFGNGTTSPVAGIHVYPEGATVNVTATANTGWQFGQWSGDVTSTDASIAVTMDTDKTITANFDRVVTPGSPGDANGDGEINAIDITLIERIIAGLDAPTTGADANQDALFNALDISKTERFIVGLD